MKLFLIASNLDVAGVSVVSGPCSNVLTTPPASPPSTGGCEHREEEGRDLLARPGGPDGRKEGITRGRAPGDREASIKDPGFARSGLGLIVLCLHSAT